MKLSGFNPFEVPSLISTFAARKFFFSHLAEEKRFSIITLSRARARASYLPPNLKIEIAENLKRQSDMFLFVDSILRF